MNPVLIYLLHVSICLFVFYGLYKLIYNQDKNYSLRRFLVIGIAIASLIIPVLNISPIPIKIYSSPTENIGQIIFAPIESIADSTTVLYENASLSNLTIDITQIIYYMVLFVLLIRIIISVINVRRLTCCSTIKSYENYLVFIISSASIQPFSFFQKIFISEKDYNSHKEEILNHELAHIKNYHVIDLIIFELLAIVLWFNPIAWIVRREIKLIHEFQADQAVLNIGIDAQKYQLLVVRKAFGERRFAMANNFTQCPILKRLKMMNKKNRNKWASIKLVLFVPLGFIMLQAFSKPIIVSQISNKVVPQLITSDSAEVWLGKWENSVLNSLRDLSTSKSKKLKAIVSVVESENPAVYLGDNYTVGKNAFVVLQNKDGHLLVENKFVRSADLKDQVKSFIKGTNKLSDKGNPETELIELPLIGSVMISKGIICYRDHVLTPESKTMNTIRILGESYLEVREETSQNKFGESYFSLNEEKQSIIDKAVPLRITFAEPKMIGSK